MESKASPPPSFNIFKVCHCVQTLTETLCPFRSGVTQDPLIVYLETKRGHMWVHTHACMNHIHIKHIDHKVGTRYLLFDEHARISRWCMCV